MKRVVISSFIILILILIGTVIGIFYARGYRFDPNNPRIVQGTGLLVLTSRPDGARVLVDGKLTTATNNTINLQPGTYEVRIEKDGYFPWRKKIDVKQETVSQANATLFPTAPRFESITSTGALNPTIDGSGSLIAYVVSSSSAEKNGLYTLNMTSPAILTLGGASTQITNGLVDSLSNAILTFSPDGTQILASISATLNQLPTTYLLSARSFNASPRDVSSTLPQLLADWDQQRVLKDQKLVDSFPKKIRSVAKSYFKNPVLSPEEDKILYTASQSAVIPLLIKPRLPGTNSTPEEREINQGDTYVYDMKEDRNYLLSKQEDAPLKYYWHPDANHLIFVKNQKINVVEYDGQNLTTVYAGPFVNNFVFPWPNGSSLVILTNLNIPDAPYNLYRISLR